MREIRQHYCSIWKQYRNRSAVVAYLGRIATTPACIVKNRTSAGLWPFFVSFRRFTPNRARLWQTHVSRENDPGQFLGQPKKSPRDLGA